MELQASVGDLVQSIQKCRKERDRSQAQRLRIHLHSYGLETHRSLGNHLVSLLVQVGCVFDAQQLFFRLRHRNEWSWNSLISGYVEKGNPSLALAVYEKMEMDHSFSLTQPQHAFLPLLKACAMSNDICRGIELHAKVTRVGLLQTDAFIGSAVVDMYAKCSLLNRAREIFEDLPSKDVVAWTTLITAYVDHGCGEEALRCFEQMQLEGISPDPVTLACSLKACGRIRALEKGGEIHAQFGSIGLHGHDIMVGTSLVDMYAKSGFLLRAQGVFDDLAVRDVVSWNALIAGYADDENGEEALDCFELMQIECLAPDAVTFACCLKACGSEKVIQLGYEMHCEIEMRGFFESEILVGNALVDMYAKCSSLDTARQVFNMLPMQDVVSWTSLIMGHVECGNSEAAIVYFEKMRAAGITPNAASYVSILKACGNVGASEKGRDLHKEIERTGLLETDVIVGNTLIGMYVKCGLMHVAQKVLDDLSIRDVVSWTTLIAGYIEHGLDREALQCFQWMQLDEVLPNAITLVSSLKLCGSMGATEKGQEIHAEMERKGLLTKNVFIGNTLLDMYAKCGSLLLAHRVFDDLAARDVVAWTTLITGYTEHGHGKEAVECFEQMQREGVSPNAATYVCSLKACSSIGEIGKAVDIHAQIEREGLVEREPVVANTLVDVYAKFGALNRAQDVFDKLKSRDVVTWTALIAGYAGHGHGEEALKWFEQMQLDGVSPNAVTFVCCLKACCETGATSKGGELHNEIERKGLLGRDIIVGNTLVDMYAQWGRLTIAQQIFDGLPARDAISCNALMGGYAQVGESGSALGVLERMVGEQIRPDAITFILVLNACSRAGVWRESRTYVEAMREQWGMSAPPTAEEEAGVVVDSLCRAGQLESAVAMIQTRLPCTTPKNVVVWNTALLAACRFSGNVEVGRRAFQNSVH